MATLSIICPAAAYSTSGIVAAFWDANVEDQSHVTLEFLCHDYRIAIALDGPARGRRLGMHSHLLPNGQHTLIARLRDASGRILDEKKHPITVMNEGTLAERVRDSLIQYSTPFFLTGDFDSALYDYANADLAPWFDRPDALDAIAGCHRSGSITEQEGEYLRQFVTKGFIVIPGMISPQLLERVNKEIDTAISTGYQNYEYGSSQRIEKLHEHYSGIRELWLHDGIMRMLRLIFQASPRPCQTLTYVFGSQQDAHQDTIHLTPFPAGFMTGVWVALQDVVPDSGELEVYVGSHRLPRVRMSEMGAQKVTGDWSEFGRKIVARWQDMIGEGRFEKLVYRPKAGTVLFWHENLMHAGSVRRDVSLPRRSIVSHVFADGCIAYYDSTGHPGHLEPKERMSARLVG